MLSTLFKIGNCGLSVTSSLLDVGVRLDRKKRHFRYAPYLSDLQ